MAVCETAFQGATSCSSSPRVCFWHIFVLRGFKLWRCMNTCHPLNLACQRWATRQEGSWALPCWGWPHLQLNWIDLRNETASVSHMEQCKSKEGGREKMYLVIMFRGARSKGKRQRTGKGQVKSHCFLQDAQQCLLWRQEPNSSFYNQHNPPEIIYNSL